MKIKLINPSQTLQKLLAKWVVGEGYTRTCMSNTCSCFSHDSGYDWLEYEIPDKVWGYVGPRIGHCPGNPSSHKSCYWVFPKLERDLLNRGSYAAREAGYVIEAQEEGIRYARYLGDYQVISNINTLAWATLTNRAGIECSVFQLVHELRQRVEDKREKEWVKKFAARDGVSFPLQGNGWTFIPA